MAYSGSGSHRNWRGDPPRNGADSHNSQHSPRGLTDNRPNNWVIAALITLKTSNIFL